MHFLFNFVKDRTRPQPPLPRTSPEHPNRGNGLGALSEHPGSALVGENGSRLQLPQRWPYFRKIFTFESYEKRSTSGIYSSSEFVLPWQEYGMKSHKIR